MQISSRRGVGLSAVALSALVLAQCSQSPVGSPTSPSLASAGAASLSALGDPGNNLPNYSEIEVCKISSTGVSGTFTISRVGVGGSTGTVVSSPFNLAPGACRIVAVDNGPDGVGSQVTITETSTADVQTVTADRIDKDPLTGNDIISNQPFTNGGTLFVNQFHGFVIRFTNNNNPPPPTGNQGCTPGYWRQDQHLDSWKVYSPGADFDATFGVNFFNPNITLLDAVALGGGDTNALARHGVAALLNAAAGSGVNYAYTTAQVIAIVKGTGAYAGLSVEARKDLLAAANEGTGGCPLN
jgi:hypothetical protein